MLAKTTQLSENRIEKGSETRLIQLILRKETS